MTTSVDAASMMMKRVSLERQRVSSQELHLFFMDKNRLYLRATFMKIMKVKNVEWSFTIQDSNVNHAVELINHFIEQKF